MCGGGGGGWLRQFDPGATHTARFVVQGVQDGVDLVPDLTQLSPHLLYLVGVQGWQRLSTVDCSTSVTHITSIQQY